MIVKIQRPLGGNEEPRAMLYDESREFFALLPFGHFEHLFADERFKVYAEVHIDGDNLVIDEVVEDQAW